MVLRLAEQLDVPLRERNQLLLAGGYAPAYEERDLEAPELAPVHDAIQRVLDGHDPYPALVVDRHWNLLAGNHSVAILTAGVAPELLRPPLNAMRLALHPDGLAPRIVNHGEWRAHLLERLARQVAVTSDPRLAELLEEVAAYPAPGGATAAPPTPAGHDLAGRIAVPLRLLVDGGELNLISIVSTFGTATDVTVAELSIEAFFPADEATAALLRAPARRRRPLTSPSSSARTLAADESHGRRRRAGDARGARAGAAARRLRGAAGDRRARRDPPAAERPPDVVLLDVLMPELDGIEVCRRMRDAGDRTPVLMLTARDEVDDRVAGLEAGADDYLAKPFALPELLARLKALLRRTGWAENAELLRFDGLELDPAACEATRDGELLSLTRTEFVLLELFLRHPRQVLTRTQIVEHVWGLRLRPDLELDRRLRRLPPPQDRGRRQGRLLHTVRGVGYVLRQSRR